MKRVVFISIGILFLIFSLIFGLRSCNASLPFNGFTPYMDILHPYIDEIEQVVEAENERVICDGYFKANRNYPSKNRFQLAFTLKGLDAASGGEIEIPLILSTYTPTDSVTVSQAIETGKQYYVNAVLHSSIGLPFSYYDYVDKLTYSVDKGYSIYFGESYPQDANINWDYLKPENYNGYEYTSHSLCYNDDVPSNARDAHFKVYIADGDGGYTPMNKAAENYESSLAAKSFLKENIGYILLTVLHAVMLALLIRYEVGTGNIVACILFALSVGLHIYGIATQKMASPFVFGSTLLSVFAFIYPTIGLFARKRVLPAILCLCAAVGEYVTYFNLYSSSDLYLPMSYTIGTILALFAAAGLFFVITAAFDEEFSSPIISLLVHGLLVAALCALCIFAIPIGMWWVGFMANAVLVMTILCSLGIGGGGYTVYLIIFD